MSYVKQAEENVVNRARAFNDALEFVYALRNFGNIACTNNTGKEMFFDGLNIMANAIRLEQSEAIRECFYFVGVGGDKSMEYSKELFEKVFGGDYSIMQFLERWGKVPSFYKIEDEKKFKKECNDIINNNKTIK